MKHRVACLDVWAPAVRDVVRGTAPSELELRFATSYDEGEQMALVEDADFLLPGWAAVTEPMLEKAKKLRMIQKWGIGYDRIDVEAARKRGIGLAITAGSNAGPVAELAIALMLAVYRRVVYTTQAMRRGHWPKAEMRESCFQLAGKTIGVVGFGNIGRMLARRLSGFDADIVYFDARRADAQTEQALNARHVALSELLAQSDIVSLHAPLTPQTAKMIDANAIASMKDGAVLINTARGELVDEAALYDALVRGKLRGAGLDAFDPEPPSRDNPLLTLDQVVVTPHAGGGVFDNVENVARHALGNIVRFLHGEPLAPADVILPATR
ncbi:MAG TPA: 2-hydroxyacid dehydrogenase [Casimicrobiaceae bacterium]|nr:2-hydroxyacid dehydrogenase [Casimicrobiaceae bacterium]